MDVQQIIPVFRSIGVEKDITLESSLDALGFDSLSKLELIVALEEHFQIAFEDDDLLSEHFQNVSTILEIVQKRFSARSLSEQSTSY